MSKPLRHGFTTGACAAAAAKGAALMLSLQQLVSEVTLNLPAGVEATFPLHGQTFNTNSSTCFVIKDAGDDPDVTNGAEIHAQVTRLSSPPPFMAEGRGEGPRHAGSEASQGPITHVLPHQGEGRVVIIGGIGIGRATKPGLAVAPGEWAINPVPRRMITSAVDQVIPDRAIEVKISIPDGVDRATRTLNARLGIIGGLSILGTTGIVRPVSAKAWTDTIDAALDVARACGCATVVLSTGRTSELAAQNSRADLPEEAYIMMGDHVEYALQACQKRDFMRPLIACQFAKLVKIACGYANTHAALSDLDLAQLSGWGRAADLPAELLSLIENANTAREIIIASHFDRKLLDLACRHARSAIDKHAATLQPGFLVADYAGNIVFRS